MDYDITKAEIDKCRKILKSVQPYEDSDIFNDKPENEFEQSRWQATCARNLLQHFRLSLTDENDYGNITK